MLILPGRIVHWLFLFDGTRRTADVASEIAAKSGVALDGGMMRRLIDFGVLTPVATPASYRHASIERIAEYARAEHGAVSESIG